jgi:RNA polymerase sigma factor (sigma-70 family)
LKNAQYAEDVVSETFLVAFRRRVSYDPSWPNARPWLFGILTKEISRYRRRERAVLRLLAWAHPDVAVEDPAEQAVALVAAREVRAALVAALAGLPARDRDVLRLVAWGGLSYEEAAQAVGIPVGTVRSRLHRARRKLGAALGGEDPTRVVEETM